MPAMTLDQAIQSIGSQIVSTVQDVAPYISAIFFVMFLARLLVLFAKKEEEGAGTSPVKAANREPRMRTSRAENTSHVTRTQEEDFGSNLLNKFNTWDRMQDNRECSRTGDEGRCEAQSVFSSGGGGDFSGGGASGSWGSSESDSSSGSSD